MPLGGELEGSPTAALRVTRGVAWGTGHRGTHSRPSQAAGHRGAGFQRKSEKEWGTTSTPEI